MNTTCICDGDRTGGVADKGIKDSGLDFLFGPNPPSLLGSGPRRDSEILRDLFSTNQTLFFVPFSTALRPAKDSAERSSRNLPHLWPLAGRTLYFSALPGPSNPTIKNVRGRRNHLRRSVEALFEKRPLPDHPRQSIQCVKVYRWTSVGHTKLSLPVQFSRDSKLPDEPFWSSHGRTANWYCLRPLLLIRHMQHPAAVKKSS